MKYVAFLRGINVGGKVIVKMVDLKTMLEGLGYTDVVTVLASGNVIFEAEKGTHESITNKIETALKKKYKREISVMLRTVTELREMDRTQPFKGLDISEATRRYVVFMYEPSRGVKIPKEKQAFRIMRIRDMDAFCVLEVSDEMGTSDALTDLGKIFDVKMTMRNWNTIEKVLKAAV